MGVKGRICVKSILLELCLYGVMGYVERAVAYGRLGDSNQNNKRRSPSFKSVKGH